jgi:hypothetical protein
MQAIREASTIRFHVDFVDDKGMNASRGLPPGRRKRR